jgi:hypothetical protein
MMIVFTGPLRPWECLPLPAVLMRLTALVSVFVFVLVLVWSGVDAPTCLLLATGGGALAVRMGRALSAPLHALA